MGEQVKTMKMQLVSRVETSMDELCRIWMNIGYTQEVQVYNLRLATDKIETVLSELIQNHTDIRRQLEEQVQQTSVALSQLSNDLQVTVFAPPNDAPLLSMQRILVEKRSELEILKLSNARGCSNQHVQLSDTTTVTLDDGIVDEQACLKSETLSPSQIERFIEAHNDVVQQVTALKYDFENDIEKQILKFQFDVNGSGNCNFINQDANRNLKTLTSYSAGHSDFSALSQPSLKAASSLSSDTESSSSKTVSLLHTDGQSQSTENAIETGSSKLLLNEALVRKTEEFRVKLIERKALLAESIETTHLRVASLWRRLNIDTTYTNRFLDELRRASLCENTLQRLREEDRRLNELKIENSSIYINSLLYDIRALQDTCYIIGNENETTVLDESHAERSSQELVVFVESLEKEVEELSSYHRRYQSIFDAFARFDVARNELMELDARLKTTEVLCNRSGLLLKLQKEQKALQKEVAKLEVDIQTAISDAEKTDGVRIEAFGMPFRDYVDAQRSETATHKARKQKHFRTILPSSAPSNGEPLQSVSSNATVRKASAQRK